MEKKESPIIIPLDGIDEKKALDITIELKSFIWGVKFNDLLDKNGIQIIKNFKNLGIKIMADPKIKDIPNTVVNRIKHYDDSGADLITIFADGGIKMIEVAKKAAKNCKILVVTILTSLSHNECYDIYKSDLNDLVIKFATDAVNAGADGVVCSPQELGILIQNDHLKGLLKVTPGIRPNWYQKKDDQKRVMTPKEAIEKGSDLLVIGRPILQNGNRVKAITKTLDEIEL